MKNPMRCYLLGVVCLALASAPALAEALTVDSILTAQKAGAPSNGIVSMVNDPANTVAMSAADLITLRDAGVSEKVIAAVWARVPVPAAAPEPLAPDDVEIVGRRLDDDRGFQAARQLVDPLVHGWAPRARGLDQSVELDPQAPRAVRGHVVLRTRRQGGGEPLWKLGLGAIVFAREGLAHGVKDKLSG